MIIHGGFSIATFDYWMVQDLLAEKTHGNNQPAAPIDWQLQTAAWHVRDAACVQSYRPQLPGGLLRNNNKGYRPSNNTEISYQIHSKSYQAMIINLFDPAAKND